LARLEPMPILKVLISHMLRLTERLTSWALGLVFFWAAATAAASLDNIVRGEVTDTSGGVLPGVTVHATVQDGKVIAATITDGLGRFVFEKLPEGPVKVVFQLDGFDTTSVEVNVQAGVESRVVERLKLAQITEQVVVYGKAPVDPPPPPPPPLPAIPYIPPPPPIIVPVPVEEMESVCGPAIPGLTPTALATIASHHRDAGRTIYMKGDEVNIDRGTLAGLEVGQNLVARRHYRANSVARDGAIGEHTAGIVQIVTASERAATAVVIHTCNELMQGDFLASFSPQPVRTPHPRGLPDYADAIRILFADAGHLVGAERRLLVIDRGGAQGIGVGQRLTLFRGDVSRKVAPFVIGEAIVVAVRTQSATIRVERATDAIWNTDWAAPQLASPLAGPTVKTTGIPQR
jgi:hypothetical protein